jgi:tetratricopeptide (TPR) repeat protein
MRIKTNLLNFRTSRFFKLVILFVLFSGGSLFSQVKMSEQPWVLPTYPVLPPEKAPMFFTNGNYQGASQYIYPLAKNDVISDKREEKAWKALILENEYIKLCVTPEIGGKLYYATDKTNNYNFVYKNNEVKPGNLGMTGAWVSGGIEWCVLHHHRASTLLPVDYSLKENENGSKTIYIGETEPRHRMRWTIGITVTPGKSYFEAEVKIANPTQYTNTFLFWANVAAHTNENYQVFFPPSVQFATFHAKNSFTRWPYSTEMYAGHDFTKGVDISWWKNVESSSSFFAYDLKEDFMGGYDHGKNTGTVHIGDHNIVKGSKLWEWGSGKRGQATEGKLTETSGPYVEIMVGAFSDNQPDYSWIRPGEVKTWKQYWYPIKDIQGFRNANLNGAVNLEPRDQNNVFVGYYSTQKVNKARIILKNGTKILLQKEVLISPEKAFTEVVKVDGTYKFTDLYTEMVNAETNEVLVSYQPVELKKEANLPEIVKSPPMPKEIATVEELYLTGNRIELFYNPRYSPMDYYTEALKRDPKDIRTNTAVGNYYLKNGDYISARKYFATAIKRVTKDYTRPSTCEALYQQGLTLKALGLYDEAVDTLYRATWDYAYHSAAYLELTQISCIKGDFKKALNQINESLSTNANNNRAIALKAAIQRKLGDFKGATVTLGNVPANDPLDFRIANEVFLISKESGNVQKAETDLASLTKKLRDFDQNYLELAVGYLNDGMVNDAEDVLKRFTGKDPEVSYYLGYIQDKKGNKAEADKLFKAANAQSEDYCFPFRLETITVLEKALQYNPKDGKAYYYIGNILYDKQPGKAIASWENAVKNEPTLAIAYRNLGWGYNRHYHDIGKAIQYYEKALSLNGTDAVYYDELDILYEANNSPVDARLKLFEGKNNVVMNRDDAFVRQIGVLTLAGKPDKSVEYLQGKKFSYREGTSRVREVIIDAQLSLGLKYYNEKNYQKALDHFLLAQIPDEEAGSARSGNRDIQVNYFIGLAYEALKNKTKSKDYYKLAAGQTPGRTGYMSYYQALSFVKLGEKQKAEEIFNKLIADGEKQVNQSPGSNSDFFEIFGEREAENVRKSQAYTLRGLGYKGAGKKELAKQDLSKAVELSTSNLWANTELKSI